MDTHEKGRHCVNSAAPEQDGHAGKFTTQESQILAALERGERLTPADALNRFGCFRLAAIIHKLKRKGHPISSIRTCVRARDGHRAHVATYWMDFSHAEPR